jgi:short-subunit dehydrogenase
MGERKLALVTGASGGIGLELARQFADHDYDAVVVAEDDATVTALMPGPTDTDFFDRAGIQDTPIYDADKDDPADVAKDGFEALMAGKDRVVAGSMKNRMQTAAGKVLPERAKAAMHARMTEKNNND